MKRLSLVVEVICGFLLFTGLYGCGGDDGNSGDSGQNQKQARSDTIAVVREVLSILVGSNPEGTQRQPHGTDRTQGDGITQQPVNVTIDCNTGHVTFAGDATGTLRAFTIDGTLTFANCEGIDGALTVNAEGTGTSDQIANTRITLTVTLHRSVSTEGCDITFHTFSIDTTTDGFGNILAPIIANGALSATCDGDNISCTFNNVDLNDQATFNNNCHS